MERYRPRGSSIPRNYRQIPAEERFSVADAAQLKLKLQALDDKLERDVDVATLEDACQARPFHEEIYVDGSEEFFLLVKGIPRADLIPKVYIEAYATLQQGRYPLNHHRISDFRKGIDPSFSEVRSLLGRIDELCSTKLDEAICALENEVTPFPFLSLPAELRLQIYAHHLRREEHISILHRPRRDRKPSLNLSIMRVNHQLHGEVFKYFYEKRTLFMLVERHRYSSKVSDRFIMRYHEALERLSPEARSLFVKMELQVGLPGLERYLEGRNYGTVDPMRDIFTLLPALNIVVITFAGDPPRTLPGRLDYAEQMKDTLEWLLSYMPPDLEVQWKLRPDPIWLRQRIDEEEALQAVIDSRGTKVS